MADDPNEETASDDDGQRHSAGPVRGVAWRTANATSDRRRRRPERPRMPEPPRLRPSGQFGTVTRWGSCGSRPQPGRSRRQPPPAMPRMAPDAARPERSGRDPRRQRRGRRHRNPAPPPDEAAAATRRSANPTGRSSENTPARAAHRGAGARIARRPADRTQQRDAVMRAGARAHPAGRHPARRRQPRRAARGRRRRSPRTWPAGAAAARPELSRK